MVGPNDLYLVQRPEITLVRDTNGDDVADEFLTINDKFGCSGDYHEYIFGPARDKAGQLLRHAQRRLRRRASIEGPLPRLLPEGHARKASSFPGPTVCAAPTA